MNRPPTMHRSSLALVLLLFAGWFVSASAQADTRTPYVPTASLVPPNAPKSTFVDDAGFGKDPFFPNSGRRPKVVVRTTEPDVPRPSVPDYLALKGISVSPKLAIINTYTVAVGEEFSFRYGSQIVKVKCLEIKERSVIISVGGATKELTLRPAFN